MPYTHLASSKNIVWKLLEFYGHNPEPIFLDAGINPELLKNSGARIKFTSVTKIWSKLTEIIDDPCFGLQTIKFWHPSYLNALGYAWLTSHTLREALNRLVRYFSIVSEAGSFLLEEDSKSLSIIVDSKYTEMRLPAHIDSTLAIIVHMARLNCGDELRPLSVHFVHSQPACIDQYFDLFKSDVHFMAARNSITFSLTDVDIHLAGSNPNLARINDNVIIQYLNNLGRENITNRVKACILDLLQSGNVADDAVAKDLGMSERSLQRQLKEEGTTFRTLKDEVRKHLALSYVRDNNIEISEIAFLLGYSEQSAFSRAFKRMTGMSPTEVRDVH